MTTPEDHKEKNARIQLFSEEERRNVVRNFITGYLGGTITLELMPKHGESIKTAAEYVKIIEETIAIATGAQKSTEVEIQRNIDGLFRNIVICRMADVLKGQFINVIEPNKIISLEQRVESLERFMKELLVTIHNIKGDNPEDMS